MPIVKLLERGRFARSPWRVRGGGCPLPQGPDPRAADRYRGPCPVRNRPKQAKLRVRSRSPRWRQHLSPTSDHQASDSHRSTGPWCQTGWGPLRYKPRVDSGTMRSRPSPWPTSIEPTLSGRAGSPFVQAAQGEAGRALHPGFGLLGPKEAVVFFLVLHNAPCEPIAALGPVPILHSPLRL